MRILQVGKHYPPALGGMETILEALSLGLRARGNSVSVLCAEHDLLYGQRPAFDADSVEVIRAPKLGTLFSQPISPRFGKLLRELAPRHDVVHVHSPHPAAELVARHLPAGTKLVCTHHSDIIRQRWALPLYRPFQREFLKRCARVIMPTPIHLKYSELLQPFEGRCVSIPFGLPPERYEANAESRELAKTLRARQGRFVLFVGRLVGYKGVGTLLQAMSLLKAREPELKLLIIGQGPLRESLETRSRELGLGTRVVFLGSVPEHSLLMAYYEASEMLVLPSLTRNEAFGLVLLEAMAHSKPLVTSRLESGVVQVNEAGINGLQAEPGDPDSLANAIQELWNDGALRERLGQEGKRRFRAEFSHERMIDSHLELYQALLS